jgi:hypothetical protein
MVFVLFPTIREISSLDSVIIITYLYFERPLDEKRERERERERERKRKRKRRHRREGE